MAKVKCRVCEHERQGFCPIKKTSVKLNKTRICKVFKHDPNKVKIKQQLPVEQRPEWFHDRKGYINKLKKEEKKKVEAHRKELFDPNKYKVDGLDAPPPKAVPNTGDAKYPMTGDLSRFTSSVAVVDEVGRED